MVLVPLQISLDGQPLVELQVSLELPQWLERYQLKLQTPLQGEIERANFVAPRFKPGEERVVVICAGEFLKFVWTANPDMELERLQAENPLEMAIVARFPGSKEKMETFASRYSTKGNWCLLQGRDFQSELRELWSFLRSAEDSMATPLISRTLPPPSASPASSPTRQQLPPSPVPFPTPNESSAASSSRFEPELDFEKPEPTPSMASSSMPQLEVEDEKVLLVETLDPLKKRYLLDYVKDATKRLVWNRCSVTKKTRPCVVTTDWGGPRLEINAVFLFSPVINLYLLLMELTSRRFVIVYQGQILYPQANLLGQFLTVDTVQLHLMSVKGRTVPFSTLIRDIQGELPNLKITMRPDYLKAGASEYFTTFGIFLSLLSNLGCNDVNLWTLYSWLRSWTLEELQYIKLAAASMGSKKIVAAVEAEMSKRL